ncbi:MAG: hypothetical protein RBU45_16275 [Myxococcota bacterium]|jgi:hypothetical protein|nr:hypothetical protein [Myxococcota bacterium]
MAQTPDPRLAPRTAAALGRLYDWIVQHGWAGYDPYDLHHWRLQLPGWADRITLRGHSPFGLPAHLAERWPLLVRRLLRLPRRIYPKALGLLADGFLRLPALLPDRPEARLLADEALRWLLAHPAPGYRGLGWGLPIDWQSRQRVPAGTPCGIVSVICGEAFWRQYEDGGEARWLDHCLGVCRGFTEDLHIDRVGPDAICFSFTPLDRFHVHNPNLWIGAYLVKIGQAAHRPDLVDLGVQAGNYALQDLRPEGYLTYWGQDQDTTGAHDAYHSGFEIRGLDSLARLTGDPRFRQAADRYLRYYAAHFFGPAGEPWRNPDDPTRIDVHGCAEALLCTAQLAATLPEAGALLARTLDWILRELPRPDGAFPYKLVRTRGGLRRVEIAYLRWGQAWMLRGLVAALERLRAPDPARAPGDVAPEGQSP